MPNLVAPDDQLNELELLRRSENSLRQQQAVLLRLALSQQNPAQSFDDKLRSFTREVGNFLEVERTSIWFLDRDNTALRCLNLYVRSADKHFSGGEMPTEKFPRYLERLDRSGVIVADNAQTDSQIDEFERDYLSKYGITSLLDTPLRVGDRLRGVLCCEHVGDPRQWTDEDQKFVMSLSDLAALTLASHDVTRTEEMLRALLDSAAQGVVAINDEGNIVLVNSLVEQMFGYRRAELLGAPFEMLVPRALDQTLSPSCGNREGHRRLADTDDPQLLGRRSDGTEFPLEIAMSDVQLHDEHMSLALLTDVTRRLEIEQSLRESEELYRSVVEDQVDLIARYTPDGVRTFANDAYCRFVGRSREDLIGKSIWEQDPVIDLERMRENFSRLSQDCPVLYYEHRDITSEGEVVINQWIDRAIFDADGNVCEIQCIGRDVTQQRAAEERLAATERLESVAILAGGIAHDFNNLLTPILIYAENLQNRLQQSSVEHSQVQQIYLAAERARTLVRQILTFGRKDQPSARVPTEVAPMVRDALQLIRMSVPSNIRLNTKIADDCGVIRAEPAEIYQLLSNLCTNACHAMAAGGTLTITADKRMVQGEEVPSGEYAEITVGDTGVGIAPTNLSRIYDPFFTTKPAGEGTGLGLSVVHGTVKDLGGSVKVESKLHHGTRFAILLPCTTASTTSARVDGAEPSSEQTLNILLVDDDELAMKSMQLVLTEMGHRVTPCVSGMEALSYLTQSGENYDVVLTDLTMPRMSGVDFARRAHELRPQLPVVLITGDTGKIDEATARRSGIADFLEKPLSTQQLSEALAKNAQARPTEAEAAAVVSPATEAKTRVLVIDDSDLVRGSLLSLLTALGFDPVGAANLTQAREILSNRPVDAILVDHHLDGENGFEELPRWFDEARRARAFVPLLVGMTGLEFSPEDSQNQLDAFLAKPFTADALQEVLARGKSA